MSSKQLTAKVRLDTTQTERKLDNLINKLNRINKLSNQAGNSNINSQLNAANNKVKQISSNVKSVNSTTQQIANTTGRLGTLYTRVASLGTNIRSRIQEWATNQKAVTSATRSTNSVLSSVWGKLKAIASTYLGIMGMRALVQTSDTITAAENKLNYLNGGDMNATKEAMDKMYTSSQKVRMSYTDMMANVSKSMTLAGDAFQNSTDNAIRFQEIMAEAYAVGGASAAEMSSSMYQMIQALGAGVLAGDELRSVREGAPLAYKAIEEFAQGVYNTNESLKELGSQGKITSDLVVAAVMNAGNEMDSAFAQTHQTFAQTWEQIKNVAKKSFEPVAHMMRDTLNSAIDDGLIDKLENVFTTISKVLQIICKVTINAINWIADNWDWLKNLIVAGLLVLVGMWIWQAGVAVASFVAMLVAMSPVQWTLLIILSSVLALVYVFYLWKTAAIDTCQAIVAALMIVGVAILLIGMIFNITALIAIGAVLLVLGVIFMFFEQVCGVGWGILTFIGNLIQTILNIIVSMIVILIALIHNFFQFCANVISGIANVVSTAADVIDAKWHNMCASMEASFWNAVADMMSDCEWLIKALNKVAEFFGKDTISIEGIRAKADSALNDKVEVPSLSDAWDTGFHKFDYVDIGALGSMAMHTFGTGVEDWSWQEAYNDGSSWAAGIKDSINEWGSKFQMQEDDTSGLLDKLGEKLGLNFGQIFPDSSGLTGANIPGISGGTGSGYDPSKALKGISDDTGKIADGMDLTQEDLEYLRRIADMEWKKEYTTAEIKVEMNNNNQINGESDLDGIVTRLADKLYEEMNVVANGVYA